MKSLKYRQIEDRTNKLISLKDKFKGINSWCKYVRTGLGMTLKQLAKKAGVSYSQIAQIERNEAQDKITLASLKKVAHAMECELIYGFVPNKKLGDIRKEQALKKAKQILAESNLHMEYEDQAVKKPILKKQLKELQEQLLYSSKIWDDE